MHCKVCSHIITIDFIPLKCSQNGTKATLIFPSVIQSLSWCENSMTKIIILVFFATLVFFVSSGNTTSITSSTDEEPENNLVLDLNQNNKNADLGTVFENPIKKPHFLLRAKFTFWVDNSSSKLPKMVNYWRSFEKLKLAVLISIDLKIGRTYQNHSKCRIWIFEFCHFPTIFLPIEIDKHCLAIRFSKTRQIDYFWLFNELLTTLNVNVARFARNAEWDILGDFQTLCPRLISYSNQKTEENQEKKKEVIGWKRREKEWGAGEGWATGIASRMAALSARAE